MSIGEHISAFQKLKPQTVRGVGVLTSLLMPNFSEYKYCSAKGIKKLKDCRQRPITRLRMPHH